MSNCLKRLGFSPKSRKVTLKSLSSIALKASFCRWQARNDKEFKTDLVSPPDNISEPAISVLPTENLKNVAYVENEKAQKPVVAYCKDDRSTGTDAAIKSPRGKPKSAGDNVPQNSKYFKKPPPLLNYGHTCYINVILQALSAAGEIWMQIPSVLPSGSPLLQSLRSFLTIMKSSSQRLEPKKVLSCLGSHISKTRRSSFKPNTDQDVPEILGYVLDELMSCPSLPSYHISTVIKESTSCGTCQATINTESSCNILRIPATAFVSTGISNVFDTKQIDGNGAWLCNVCGCEREAIQETSIANAPFNLIIQVQRFVRVGPEQHIRNNVVVTPCKNVTLKVSDGSVLCYQLVAVIHHSGSMNSGHYWVKTLDRSSNKWFNCNDLAITEAKLSPSKTSSVLFYIMNQLSVS